MYFEVLKLTPHFHLEGAGLIFVKRALKKFKDIQSSLDYSD